MGGEIGVVEDAARGDLGDGAHAAGSDFLRHDGERRLCRLREAGGGVDQQQAFEQRAMPRRERHGYEPAEAVAEYGAARPESQRAQGFGDTIGIVLDGRPGIGRVVKAREREQMNATMAREKRHDALEGRAVDEQRMQQHEIRPLARRDDVDHTAGDLDSSHQPSLRVGKGVIKSCRLG